MSLAGHLQGLLSLNFVIKLCLLDGLEMLYPLVRFDQQSLIDDHRILDINLAG